jgi:Fe-S cluster assembly protein SufD
MTTTLASQPPFKARTPSVVDEAAFYRHLEESVLPASAKERMKDAWRRFEALPMPKRKDEKWRFASRVDFDLADFTLPSALSAAARDAVLERSNLVSSLSSRLIFADHQLVHQDPLPRDLAEKGVVFEPLAAALDRMPELVESYLFRTATQLGAEKFHALHESFLESGYVLSVPDGVEIKDPFVTYHWHTSDGAALFPHVLVIAGAHSTVNLVDFCFSLDEEATGFSCSVGNVFARPGAKVFRKTVQAWNERVVGMQLDTNNAFRDAEITAINLNMGGRRSRFENEVRIEEPGAHINLYSLTVAQGEQEFDQRTLQIHGAPDATSNLLYKNALMDRSRTIFSGLIRVDPGAQRTDAYQTNRNLLLDPTADANSLPGLEIEANDVKCSHGATTGRLDQEELFYMLQRGIPKPVAQELLVFGFFEEVIEKFENDELEENLRELIRGKFRRKLRTLTD